MAGWFVLAGCWGWWVAGVSGMACLPGLGSDVWLLRLGWWHAIYRCCHVCCVGPVGGWGWLCCHNGSVIVLSHLGCDHCGPMMSGCIVSVAMLVYVH